VKPINRPDGRHWCNPGSEDPSVVEARCPECGAGWRCAAGENGLVWRRASEEEMTDGR
jgi:hypothetical protein